MEVEVWKWKYGSMEVEVWKYGSMEVWKYGSKIFDFAKILHLGNPLRIVLMADFQGKSPHRAENPKNGAILNLKLKILLPYFHTSILPLPYFGSTQYFQCNLGEMCNKCNISRIMNKSGTSMKIDTFGHNLIAMFYI